jgi:hypothetical protein
MNESGADHVDAAPHKPHYTRKEPDYQGYLSRRRDGLSPRSEFRSRRHGRRYQGDPGASRFFMPMPVIS